MKRVLREVLLGAVGCVALWPAPAAAQEAEPRSSQPNPAAPAESSAQPPAPEAESPPPAAEGGAPIIPGITAGEVVRRIQVRGNQRVESSTVLSYVPLQAGDVLTPQNADAAIKTLFATGLFADVQVASENGVLTIIVVENPIVNRVIFEGARALKEEDIEKEVQAKPRSVFTAARVQADVQRIIELYRRSGRFAATVTPSVRELEQNRVDLIFTMVEGPTTGVRSVNFIGNRAFSDGELRGAIVTEQSKWWKILTSNDNYDPDRLDYDRELLRQYYTNRGYADFLIVSAVAELAPDQKDFFITFTIDEGLRYDFGDIKVVTELDRLPEELLRAASPIREGQLFKGELIEDSIDSMTFVAGAAGYANVDIRPVIDRDRENRKVNITFQVNEGPRVFVDRIDIIGNNRTVDDVIRREMRLVEGDAFNRILLDRSRARLRGLGFFKEVEIEEKPSDQPDRTDVEVRIQEDATGEVAFQAGFSTTENFLFDVSITQRNLRGRGQFLRARASTSRRRQQLDLRFTEPRFLGRNLAAGVDLFLQRTDFLDVSAYETTSYGGSVRAGFPVTRSVQLGLTYTIRNDDINIADINVQGADGSIVDQCDPLNIGRSVLCDQEGQFLTSILGYSLSLDKRNDPITPTRGFNLIFAQDFAGAGGEVQYVRSQFEGTTYRGILPGIVASLSLSAGFVLGWNGDDVRINDRFFKGGSSFRGFAVAGVGPRQLTLVNNLVNGDSTILEGDALGGNAFGIGTFQVEFPLGLPKEFGLRGAAFYEFGTVGLLDDSASLPSPTFSTPGFPGLEFSQFVSDDLSYRSTAGVSIFWDSPFGPVQFDFAQPLSREPYDQPEVFRFSTRSRF